MAEYELAIKLLIVYESKLPIERRPSLPERVEAMENAVRVLKLQPGSGVNWESLGVLGQTVTLTPSGSGGVAHTFVDGGGGGGQACGGGGAT